MISESDIAGSVAAGFGEAVAGLQLVANNITPIINDVIEMIREFILSFPS
jgi:hypothetical protein